MCFNSFNSSVVCVYVTSSVFVMYLENVLNNIIKVMRLYLTGVGPLWADA